MIRLRPHHLLCILTYVGRGYTPAFVENLDRIVRALAAGQLAVLVDGPDDICGPLAIGDRHCERQSVLGRDAAALRVVGRLLDNPLVIGDEFAFTDDLLRILRGGYLANRDGPCSGCEWHSFCGAVAAAGFHQTSMAPEGIAPSPASSAEPPDRGP